MGTFTPALLLYVTFVGIGSCTGKITKILHSDVHGPTATTTCAMIVGFNEVVSRYPSQLRPFSAPKIISCIWSLTRKLLLEALATALGVTCVARTSMEWRMATSSAGKGPVTMMFAKIVASETVVLPCLNPQAVLSAAMATWCTWGTHMNRVAFAEGATLSATFAEKVWRPK